MIQISCLDDLDALAPRKEEWNALVARSATNTVYQTYEWHVSWWHAFGAGAQALVLLAEADGKLVGIAPLMCSRRRVLGRKRRVVEFIGATLYGPCDFIIARDVPEALPLLLQWLADHRAQWSLLLLAPIPNEATRERVAAFFTARGLPTHQQRLGQVPVRILGDSEADRKTYTKQDLRKGYNALSRQGKVAWTKCADAPEALGYLDLFVQFHMRRWAGTDTPSLFLQPPYLAFHRELLCAMAPTGWLYFSALRLDQKPIALSLAFNYDNRVFLYRSTFDVDWAAYSPGMMILKFQLQDAVERQVSEIHFGSGQEPYKIRFANHSVTHYGLWVFQNALTYSLDLGLLQTLAYLERFPTLKQGLHRLIRPFQDH